MKIKSERVTSVYRLRHARSKMAVWYTRLAGASGFTYCRRTPEGSRMKGKNADLQWKSM